MPGGESLSRLFAVAGPGRLALADERDSGDLTSATRSWVCTPRSRAGRFPRPVRCDAQVLTSICAECTNFHMRTTLVIEDALFRELKRRAAEQQQRTLSDVTQDVLRRGLAGTAPPRRRKPSRLPVFAMGPPRVDLADRNLLDDALDRS